MSIEHTNNTGTNNEHKGHKRRPRTKRWYHDSQVGVEDLKSNALARYFISTAEDEIPEIFLVLMNREVVRRDDGTFAMKSTYAGDIERNAIPISTLDIDALYTSLVNAKARMARMQQEFCANTGREVTQPPPAQPKRSQQQPAPLTHRLHIPKAVVRQVKEVEQISEKENTQDIGSLAKLLTGW